VSITCSVFIATSIDGFIARTDGSIDWLNEANARVPAGEDCGYSEFMNSVDTLVMGRNTFELVLGFDKWPYGDKPVVALSSKPLEMPESLPPTVSVSSETPRQLAVRLESARAKRLYIDGGVTIQRFLAAGLIEDITITVIPILLGEGRPLFGPLESDIRLDLVSTKAYDFGFVQSKYHVIRP
jgi:dihydrofolate reductase